MLLFSERSLSHLVAPFAGAWIEIHKKAYDKTKVLSLPSRERGLKFLYWQK